jgi:hypothetical protein
MPRQRPRVIAGQTVCYAVRLESGKPTVRVAGPGARRES